MRRLICMLCAVMMGFWVAGGLVGCKEEGSPPAGTENITPQAEETMPPMETPPAPAERQPREEWKEKVTGIISDISPDTGKMTITDASGISITFSAGPNVDLKGFRAGDQVVAEYSSDGVIQSIEKQTEE